MYRRQSRTALPIRSTMLGARVQMPQENASIVRGNGLVRLYGLAHSGKLLRRHDEKKQMICLRQEDKLLSFIAPPTGWNRDAILLVNRMAKLSGVEVLRWRKGIQA